MRNLLLIHLESLNYISYQTNRRLFPTLHHCEEVSLSFSKYYATATSTLMVASDMAYGGMMQNEPSRRLTDKLGKYCYKSSFLNDLKARGYQVRVLGYPNGTDGEGASQKNFLGYAIKMEETGSYENHMSAIDAIMTKDKPFAIWTINYICNVSYNHNMQIMDSLTSLERWEESYRHIDNYVNEILSMLEQKGLLDSTTILFYGDHGDDMYSHGKHEGLTHAFEPYTTLIHTPFWIYDSRFQKGIHIEQLIDTTDVRRLIEQLLSLPERKLEIGDLKLPERKYSLSRNMYAAQMLKAGSFNKGYSLIDGKFLLMADNEGMQLFHIEMDPTCHHNLLDYFYLEDGELVLDKQKYGRLAYHFTNVIDEGALRQIRQVFFTFREQLRKDVLRLYQYAECEEHFSEIAFHKINYGIVENKSNCCERNQTGAVAEILNRLLNCMGINNLAVYKKVTGELKGLYSAVNTHYITQLEQSTKCEILYIECEDESEFNDNLTWIEQNRNKPPTVVYIKKVSENLDWFEKWKEIPCQCSGMPMDEGKIVLFGEIFEDSEDEDVPADFKVLAVMHVYNEADILEKSIEYLLSQEVDIYLVDNWSDDGSYEIMQKYQMLYPDRVFLERFPFDEKNEYYDWYHQLERTEQITQELDYNWYIHHDADEMRVSPWENKNLREAIYYVDKLGFNAIDNTVIDFKLTRDDENNIFMRDTYFDFRHFLSGFRQRKIWKKGKSIDLKSTGGHIARIEKPKVFPLKILNRHYPLRELDQARKKIFIDRKPRFVKERKELGWHGHYDSMARDEDLFTNKKDLILWDDSVWSRYYVSLFMGCGIRIDEDRSTFDICLRYFSGKKVVLYGAGNYGIYCLERLAEEAEVVAWVDRNFEYMPQICCRSVESIDCLHDLEFDVIFIAIQNNTSWVEVKDVLIDIGVPPKKIY